MPALHKKKSKRISTRTRCKIEKKVREHNRKQRRKEKLASKKKQNRKDPGVPNNFPFKEQVLKEAEAKRQRLEEERLKAKQKRKEDREKLHAKKRNLDGLVKDAEKRGSEFSKQEQYGQNGDMKNYESGKGKENSRKAYYKEFKKVVASSDVILQVLDARDPLGSRCSQMEQTILEAGSNKRLVLLLNKIDLVPKENVEKWLKYLRGEFPTIAFKSSTQEQANHLSQCRVDVGKASEDLRQSSLCLGADTLMKLLGNYCRNKDIKTTITVGIVGFPNTGKSSVINSLKRSRACTTGAMPGVTKTMQQVQLDKHIKLLDSPGVVMASGTTDAQLILRNCVKIETVQDPTSAVEAILRRCNKQKMMLQYNVGDYKDTNEFLAFLAMRFGRLRKGGIPNTTKAARILLQDWNTGKIRYYTEPPEQSEVHISADIVSAMSKEFDIDGLLNEDQKVLEGLKPAKESDMQLESLGAVAVYDATDEGMESEREAEGKEEEGDSDEYEDMEDEEEGEEKEGEPLKDIVINPGDRKTEKLLRQSKQRAELLRKKAEKYEKQMALPENRQLGKQLKKTMKKQKKDRKRADALGGKLSDALEGALSSLGTTSNENYDFSGHFK